MNHDIIAQCTNTNGTWDLNSWSQHRVPHDQMGSTSRWTWWKFHNLFSRCPSAPFSFSLSKLFPETLWIIHVAVLHFSSCSYRLVTNTIAVSASRLLPMPAVVMHRRNTHLPDEDDIPGATHLWSHACRKDNSIAVLVSLNVSLSDFLCREMHCRRMLTIPTLPSRELLRRSWVPERRYGQRETNNYQLNFVLVYWWVELWTHWQQGLEGEPRSTHTHLWVV